MAIFKKEEEKPLETMSQAGNHQPEEIKEELVDEMMESFSNDFDNQEKEEVIPKEESILYADVIVNGDISTQSNLSVFGQVNGSIDCKYNLRIESSVNANITAGSVNLHNATVTGDVVCKKEVAIDSASVVKGNIEAESCVLDGKITGNITVKDSLHIQKNAYISGDIIAGQLSVLQGARIEGRVTMTSMKEK